ncbi:MAG: DUF4232 domain-containing protein [Streptosporangiaceae bacterium]
MNLSIRAARRIGAAAAIACAAALTPAIALAAPGAATAPAASTAPACQTPGLVEWINTSGSGAAGSVFYQLKFTNLSGHRCTLNGFPYVLAVNLRGHQVGRRAAFGGGTPRQVTLRKGHTATALLQIVDVGNFPAARCRPVTAAGLRVYPPNQTRAKVIPFPFRACSKTGPVYLSVRPVR